jgi:hypothetical protein
VLAERFALSPFERSVLLLAAGVEMDGELAPCAAPRAPASPGPASPWPWPCCPTPTGAPSRPAPLRRWRLLDTVGDGALLTARLQIDERVLHYLAGIDELDARLRPCCAIGPRRR